MHNHLLLHIRVLFLSTIVITLQQLFHRLHPVVCVSLQRGDARLRLPLRHLASWHWHSLVDQVNFKNAHHQGGLWAKEQLFVLSSGCLYFDTELLLFVYQRIDYLCFLAFFADLAYPCNVQSADTLPILLRDSEKLLDEQLDDLVLL